MEILQYRHRTICLLARNDVVSGAWSGEMTQIRGGHRRLTPADGVTAGTHSTQEGQYPLRVGGTGQDSQLTPSSPLPSPLRRHQHAQER